MYIGFNLKLNLSEKNITDYYELGLKNLEKDKVTVRNTLDELLLPNGSLDGTTMQNNWFPQIEADIFLSHSHKDERMAIALAGLLLKHLNVKVFVDSCIWGYSNDLLKIIDNRFCKLNSDYYDYNKRNYSTSHVHMMLASALNMMIDKTECLFFLNTPQSITTEESINSTLSPWIYAEITTSQLIQRKALSEYRIQVTEFSKKAQRQVLTESISYELDLHHLTELNEPDISKWLKDYADEKYALDVLYNQKFGIN